jgi:hypothetical protein
VKRTVPACLALLAALPVLAADDIQLALRLEHRTVLQFEPLFAFLAVRNNGLQPFVTPSPQGETAVRFVIVTRRGEPVPLLYDDPAIGKARVEAGRQRLFMRDLTRWYDVRSAGVYVITAELDWNGRTYCSERMMVDVVPGITVLDAENRVSAQPDRVRVYSLRYWPRGGMEQLFLRVDEPASGMNYGVFLLGPVVRVGKPRINFEATGRVVIRHQSDVGVDTHSAFVSTPEQVRFLEQHKLRRGTKRRNQP